MVPAKFNLIVVALRSLKWISNRLREKLNMGKCSIFVDCLYFFVRLGLIKLPRRCWTVLHLRRFLHKSETSIASTKKIAFLIHDECSFSHIRNILRHLPQGTFDFVACSSFDIYHFPSLVGFVRSRILHELNMDKLHRTVGCMYPHCHLYTINEIVESGRRFSCVCYCFSGLQHTFYYKGRFGLQLIADRLNFFLFSPHYLLRTDVCDFGVAAKCFCVGPNQEKFLKTLKTGTEIVDYGSPRFDNISETSVEMRNILTDFGNFNFRKKVLFFPIIHGFSKRAMIFYAEFMQRFTVEYSVVCKPYICDASDRDWFSIVRYKAADVFLLERDALDCMLVADFVFCLSGGSFLTAVGVDKNVFLLGECTFFWRKFGRFFGVGDIADKLGIFSINDYDKIAAVLKDDAYWERQRVVRAELRKQFFSFHKEPSGKLIADELMRDLRAASERNVKP